MRTSEAWTSPRSHAPAPGMGDMPPAAPGSPWFRRALWARDEEFVALLRAYRRHGGLARQLELVQRGLPWPVPQGPAIPIRFDWANHTWLPLFQFEPETTTVRTDVRRVVRELGQAFDDWHLARWFVEPNSWLGDEAPADLLSSDVEAVRAAARADRFVAMG